MSKGFLVSLEGPEGAGKTSVLEVLLPILEEKGVEVLTTREPGGVLIGEKIREVILDPSHTRPARIRLTTRCQPAFLRAKRQREGVWVFSICYYEIGRASCRERV